MLNSLRPSSMTASSEALNRWRQELDDWFTHYVAPPQSGKASSFSAPLSVYDDDASLVVEVDLPGVARQDLQVNFEDETLRISAERKREESENRQYLYEGRAFGKIERELQLPKTVDPNSIEAELNGGVLRIKMSKKPELKPRQIEVKEG